MKKIDRSWFSYSPYASQQPAHYTVSPNAEQRSFLTRDKLTLFGQWWIPKYNQPKAVVLLIPGALVHSGFYALWADHLVENNYAVLGLDLRGWGQSQGFGRRGFVLNYDQYLEDLALAYSEVKQQYPILPIYIQGESFGGLVALFSQVKGDLPVNGLILNAPAVRLGLRIGPFRQPYWYVRSVIWSVSGLANKFPNYPAWLIPGFIMKNGAGFIVKDKKIRKQVKNDPYIVHEMIPLSVFVQYNTASQTVQKNLTSIKTPLILLHGTKDSLVPVSSSEYIYKHINSDDKTLQTYEGLNHLTLMDIGRTGVWSDIVDWLNQMH